MMLLSFFLGLGITALYAAGLVAVAWRIAAWKGIRWLPLAWLAGGFLYCALTLARLWVQGAAIHLPPRTAFDRLAVFTPLELGLAGAALVTLSVRKRLIRSGGPGPTSSDVRAGVGAFLGGMLLVFAVVAVKDFAALLHQMSR